MCKIGPDHAFFIHNYFFLFRIYFKLKKIIGEMAWLVILGRFILISDVRFLVNFAHESGRSPFSLAYDSF